jgi:hypothetical protein
MQEEPLYVIKLDASSREAGQDSGSSRFDNVKANYRADSCTLACKPGL